MVNTAQSAVGRDFGRAEAMHHVHVGRGHRPGGERSGERGGGRGEELVGHAAGVASRGVCKSSCELVDGPQA